MASKAHLINELRRGIANAVADYKAYDVPAVCSRIGLAPGDGSEAFNSKFKYAFSRLHQVPAAELAAIGRRLLEETDNSAVSELVDKVDELDQPTISELTRRRIIALFDRRSLSTEMEQFDFIRRTWPISDLPSPYAKFEIGRAHV